MARIHHHAGPRFSRRTLLAGTAVLLGSKGCSVAPQRRDDVFGGLPRSRTGEVLLGQFDPGVAAVHQAAELLDWSWLSKGDSVLLKVASNSALSHPSTTSPDAITGMVEVLKARGAGRVVVADQAGVEWVRYRNGVHVGERTTEGVFERNGILQAARDAGAEVHVFDLQPYDTGYFAGTSPGVTEWESPVQIPSVVREVDHIIYLPRLSAHAITGYTMALKMAVGWMRDDSRLLMHRRAENIYEKYAEASWLQEIHSRLRLVFTYASHILLDVGPDVGTKKALPHATVVATTHPADHDVVGSNILLAMDGADRAALDLAPFPPVGADLWNRYLLRYWDKEDRRGYVPMEASLFWEGLTQDRAVRHAYVMDGVVPSRIQVRLTGYPLPEHIERALKRYDRGLLELLPA